MGRPNAQGLQAQVGINVARGNRYRIGAMAQYRLAEEEEEAGGPGGDQEQDGLVARAPRNCKLLFAW